jgi:hypothetical protein
MCPGTGALKEDSMGQQTVKRMSTEKLGEELLKVIAAFETHKRFNRQSRGFWTSFAEWANADPRFSHLGGNEEAWSGRYHTAAQRYSPAGRQHAAIGKRALDIAKAKKIAKSTLYDALGGGYIGTHRLKGTLPWPAGEDFVVELAKVLNVHVEELVGTHKAEPTAPIPAAPAPAPAVRQLSIQQTNTTAHTRMLAVIEKLRSLATAKRSATPEMLSALIAYVDGVDALDIITSKGAGA